MTPSQSASLLLPLLTEAGSSGLLVADENCVDFPFSQLTGSAVLSNRWDIANRARHAGCPTYFSDFDFQPWQAGKLTLLAGRVAKEKAVVHHLANSAATLLEPGGQLVLVGTKQEGIKSFAKTLTARLGGDSRTEKHGTGYRLIVRRGQLPGSPLDDQDYPRLRSVFSLNDKPVASKPGLFGWDRIDEGSALLTTQLGDFFARFTTPPRTLLDLGCGYGYLTLMAAQYGSWHITATDNCAAALAAAADNVAAHGITGDVMAADAGDNLAGPFEALLCNPPFHQGFQTDRNLTTTFLQAARRLLHSKGRALFVVNGFVPLERLAVDSFSRVEVAVDTGRFKVVELSRPRRS